MAFFLEKYFIIDEDGNLQPAPYSSILVRPCNETYDSLLEWIQSKSEKTITLDGQIASFADGSGSYQYDYRKFSSIEEWLIWLEIEKGITIDFEDILVESKNFKSYVAKTIDYHTKKTLDDRLDEVVKIVKKDNAAKS